MLPGRLSDPMGVCRLRDLRPITMPNKVGRGPTTTWTRLATRMRGAHAPAGGNAQKGACHERQEHHPPALRGRNRPWDGRSRARSRGGVDAYTPPGDRGRSDRQRLGQRPQRRHRLSLARKHLRAGRGRRHQRLRRSRDRRGRLGGQYGHSSRRAGQKGHPRGEDRHHRRCQQPVQRPHRLQQPHSPGRRGADRHPAPAQRLDCGVALPRRRRQRQTAPGEERRGHRLDERQRLGVHAVVLRLNGQVSRLLRPRAAVPRRARPHRRGERRRSAHRHMRQAPGRGRRGQGHGRRGRGR